MKTFVRLDKHGHGRLFEMCAAPLGHFAFVEFDNGARTAIHVVHRPTGASIVACDSLWRANACAREFDLMADWDFDEEAQARFTADQREQAKTIRLKYSVLPDACAVCGMPAEVPHHHAFDPADAGEASTKE